MPVVPEALDFERAQVLLIGEGMGNISMAGEGVEEIIVELEAEVSSICSFPFCDVGVCV